MVTEEASPSSPSVKFTPFTVPMTTIKISGMVRIPKSSSCPGIKGIFMVRGTSVNFTR